VAGWLSRLSLRVALSVAAGAALVLALSFALFLFFLADELRAVIGKQVYATVARAADDIDGRLAQRKRALAATAEELQRQPPAPTEHAAQRFLDGHGALASLFDVIVLIDANGRVVADRPRIPGLRGADVSDREYFKQVRDATGIVMSEPLLGRSNRAQAVVVFAAPIRAPDGSFAGAMIGSLQLIAGIFFEDIRTAALGDSGYFTATTKRGTVLAHRDAARVMEAVPGPEQMPELHRALQGWNGWAEGATRDGVPAVKAYKSLREAPWVIIGALPSEEAFAPLARVQRLAVGVGIVAALVLAGLTWLVGARNLAPLARVSRQIGEIEAGERAGHLDERGAREIRAVAQSFNRLLQRQTQLRDALAEREAFHRTLNDSSPVGVFLASGKGELSYANARFEQMVGRGLDELTGWQWLEAIHPDDRIRARDNWLSARRRKVPFAYEFRFVRPGGDIVFARLHAEPMAEPHGAPSYLHAVLDMTAEHKARAQLAQEKLRGDRILEAIEDAIIVLDRDGAIAHFSPGAERLLGWRRESVTGVSFAQVVRLYDESDGSRIELAAFRPHARLTSDKWLCETAQGQSIPVEVRWTRIDENAGAGAVDVSLDEDFGGVLTVRDASERRNEARRIAWDAHHDSLTKLANRRHFEAVLLQHFERFVVDGVNTALVLLDLDHFKQVNDRAGHAAGDEMLCKVARVLSSAVRSSDLAARLGGDEFALLLPGCSTERAAAIAEAIRDEVATLSVRHEDAELRVGICGGVSAFAVGDDGAFAVTKRADAACYRSKEAGRNRVETEEAAGATVLF
jgi:diguanylate cyclase (GGDEF)-like protein/PAS domain S-box-containing protein